MSFSSTFSFLNTRRHLVFASLAYGFLVWLALPDRVVAIDDDFGYLRSIQETWQHGRSWTHSFLVPFSASTSVLVCLGFAVTGSMAFAVHSHLSPFMATPCLVSPIISCVIRGPSRCSRSQELLAGGDSVD